MYLRFDGALYFTSSNTVFSIRHTTNSYPAIHSIGQDTKFTVAFSFFMYGYRFLSRGFTDRRELLQGGSATSWKVFSHFRDSPRDGPNFGCQQGAIWRNMLLAEALVYSAAD